MSDASLSDSKIHLDHRLLGRADGLSILLIGLFAIVLVRTAWLSDDAYITFRTVDNFLDGYGLRWNVAERVQSYTHALWMMVLAVSQWITGEPYFTTIALSIGFTIGALAAVIALASSASAAIIGLTFLLCSKAFVDFSTSGLENPLTHALLGFFWWVNWRHTDRLGLLGLSVALILLNRMDCVLLVAPQVAVSVIGRRSVRQWALFAAGLTPFAAWELFSFIYYGALVPNTAYAKLASVGIGRRQLAVQAAVYFQDSITRDPITITVIVVAIIWAGLRWRTKDWPAAAGLLLYLGYIVRIGGDFMTGRLLTAPFFMAVLILVRRLIPRGFTVRWAAAVAVLAIAVFAPRSNFSGSHYGEGDQLAFVSPSGIADERAFYYQWTGLLKVLQGHRISETRWARDGQSLAANGPRVMPSQSVGLVGYYAGANVHIVDIYGLCDPLLSRLPSTDAWRIGHFARRIPDGYLETLADGALQIQDDGLREFYSHILLLTRAQLWTRQRFETAIAMSLRRYDGLQTNWRPFARVSQKSQLVGTID